MITFLSGGTGTPKLIQGFRRITTEENISIIANSADNIWIYGLYVSPDIDTVLYLLSNQLDLEKYWGVKNETFIVLATLKEVGLDTWFRLGDKDLGLHIFRTSEMQRGKKQTEIIDNLRKKLKIKAKIFPSSETHIETRIITDMDRDIHFQDFWVKNKGNVEIKDVYVKDVKKAIFPSSAQKELQNSERIIIGPSNPITSIGPMLDITAVRKSLEKNKEKCMVISPIIGDKPVSGPTGKLMKAKGFDVSPIGIAKFYEDVCSTIIIHETDESFTKEIENETDLEVITQNILFTDDNIARNLADFIFDKE
jgi:LPPG:FO 2-phospho-L-lactate transferase